MAAPVHETHVIELGPSLQQADALPPELRRTLLSYAAHWLRYAAPYWTTPHPTELRRTLLIYAAP